MPPVPATVGDTPSQRRTPRLPVLLATISFLTLLVGTASSGLGSQQAAQQQKTTGADDFETLWQRAERGDATAQCVLGIKYASGEGIPQDYAQAAAWLRKAAEQGVGEAQHNLGLMYDTGRGVPRDYAQAAVWYRKAADQGHAPAQFNLGAMYFNGQGMPQDYVEAHRWVNLAAARRYPCLCAFLCLSDLRRGHLTRH